MSVQQAAMEFDGKEIHPVTDSDIVKHGNTNVKDILDSLPSSSSFMNSLLACTDASQVRKILQVYPQTFWDECQNNWEPVGCPTLSNGELVLDGSSYLKCTPGTFIPFSGSTTIEFDFQINSNTVLQRLCYAGSTLNSSAVDYFGIFVMKDGKPCFDMMSPSGSTAGRIFSADAVSTNTWYHIEIVYDATDFTRYLFVDGSLKGSKVGSAALSTQSILLIGANPRLNDLLDGKIKNFRISNCARHTSDFTWQKPTLDANTVSLLFV